MANYQSEAYDLNQFAPQSARITPFPGKKAQKADRRRAKLQKVINTAAVVMIGACVLMILGLMISSQVRITEMNNAIGQAETRLNEATAETKRLESELASQTSAQSVEKYAESEGFRQVESGQIDYITVTPAGSETTTQVGVLAKIWKALTGWLK